MAPTAIASRPARRSASSASRRAPWRRSASRRRSAASDASASTATATTAIAEAASAGTVAGVYRGRFAPSPTGSLHLGSLVAALGSFLDARSRGGSWLVRIEDVDVPRVISGCATQMLRTLEALGLTWDGPIEYQSARLPHYQAALERLDARGLTFQCSCSRRERSGGGYPGTCRGGPTRAGPTATRFRVDDRSVAFSDRVQGECCFALASLGDVIVRRRDGLIAYQLAVVVDDALQGITDVVRGADLIDNTPWQLALQQALDLPQPRYAHLPLVTEPGGGKLAKSRRSVAVEPGRAGAELHRALTLLRQQPPAALKSESAQEVLRWAQAHWMLDRVHKVATVEA